jgi:AAA domain
MSPLEKLKQQIKDCWELGEPVDVEKLNPLYPQAIKELAEEGHPQAIKEFAGQNNQISSTISEVSPEVSQAKADVNLEEETRSAPAVTVANAQPPLQPQSQPHSQPHSQPQGQHAAGAAPAYDPFPFLPAALKESNGFAVWTGNLQNKQPYISGTMIPASYNNPDHLVTYEVAIKNILEGKGYLYLGLVPGDGRVPFDIDSCRDPQTGVVSQWAIDFIKLLPSTYIEVTPSQTGLRAWLLVPSLAGQPIKIYKFDPALAAVAGKDPQVEVLTTRFATITGVPYLDAPSTVAELSEQDYAPIQKYLEKLESENPNHQETTGKKTKSVLVPGTLCFEEVAAVANPAFNALYEEVGWKPFELRVGKMKDERFHNFKVDVSEKKSMTFCPMPQHRGGIDTGNWKKIFGSYGDGDAVKCFGCGFQGDMVSAVRAFDAGEDGGKIEYATMYDCGRAICVEQGLDPEEYFPQQAKTANTNTDAAKQEAEAETQARLADAMQEAQQNAAQAAATQEQTAETAAFAVFNAIETATLKRSLDTGEPDFDYEGLIPTGAFCAWLAAMKAEKSLFALRKAMCDASGHSWMNYKNMRGPLGVLYFDAENTKSHIYDRRDEILGEFFESEQDLILDNLRIVSGKDLREMGYDIEYNNKFFWERLASKYASVGSVYLDCWYQLHSLKASDGSAQKNALDIMQGYFKGKTIFLPHHVGRESDDAMQKKNPRGLKEMGAHVWMNKVSQSMNLPRKADLIICQEKVHEFDEDSNKIGEHIDFQVYSRGEESPLLTFEPVYYDDDGNEFKYRRKMRTSLSSLAASILNRFQGRGPWDSKYALAREVGRGGNQYHAIKELQGKGFLLKDDRGFYFSEDHGVVISDAARSQSAIKQATEFLKRLLLKGGQPIKGGVQEKMLKELAKNEGVLLGSSTLYEGVRSFLNLTDGEYYWSMQGRVDEAEQLAQEVERLINQNPNITKARLMELTHTSSDRALDNALEALGLTRVNRWKPWQRDGVPIQAPQPAQDKPSAASAAAD